LLCFDRDLEKRSSAIHENGRMVEDAIRLAAQSLETRDEELARSVGRRGQKPSTRLKS